VGQSLLEHFLAEDAAWRKAQDDQGEARRPAVAA
jgi:hypothetical protein